MAYSKEFGARLKAALGSKKKGLFAREVAVYPHQLSRYLAGQIPDPPVLIRLARAVGRSIDYLLTGQDRTASFSAEGLPLYEGVKPRAVPVLTWVQAGAMMSAFACPDEDSIMVNVRGKNCFALKVRGTSMEPEFRQCDLIVVDPDRQAQFGDYVVVKCDEESEAVFKQYVRLQGVECFRPINRAHPDIPRTEKHRIVGRVVKLVRKV
jgi:SOS-response transcriptional repressor LexA